MTEAEFQQVVLELARVFSWRHMHVRRSIGKGRKWTTATNVPWPDLTLWHDRGGFMVRELKVADRWQPGQKDVLEQLARAGVDVGVWMPEDFDSGLIARQFSQNRGGRVA